MHMHTLKIAVLEPAEAFDLTRLQDEMVARLAELPPLQRRALPVPFHLNHPLWVTDRAVDPRHHVFAHDVPAPGRHGRPGGADRPGGRYSAGPHPPAVGDARLPAVRRQPDRRDHQDAPRARRRRRRQRAARQHRRRPRRRPATGADRPRRDVVLEPTPTWSDQIRMALVDAIRQIGDLPGLISRTVRALAAVLRHRACLDGDGAAAPARRAPHAVQRCARPRAATSPRPPCPSPGSRRCSARTA